MSGRPLKRAIVPMSQERRWMAMPRRQSPVNRLGSKRRYWQRACNSGYQKHRMCRSLEPGGTPAMTFWRSRGWIMCLSLGYLLFLGILISENVYTLDAMGKLGRPGLAAESFRA